jgi:hypothetical protein
MISDILTGLDKKFEGRINAFYTFAASLLAIVAIMSGGEPPLAVLSALSGNYLGASIPWFEVGQSWIAARSWLAPEVCTALVLLAAVAVVLQGWNALRSRSSATLWLIAVLAVSRGTGILTVTLAITAVLVIGGLFRQRTDGSGLIPATAVLLGLIAAPVRLAEVLWGAIFSDNEAQDVRDTDHGQESHRPSGAKVAR